MKKLVGIISACLMLCTAAFAEGYFSAEDQEKGTITEDMFCMMSADYLREIETMTKRIETIDNEIKSLEIVKEERKQADEILKKYKHIDKLNRVIVDEFIDKVYVGCYNKETKTRDIEIEWNIEF